MRDKKTWDELLERTLTILVPGLVVLNALLFGGVQNPEFSALAAFGCVLWAARFWLNRSHRLLFHPVVLPLLGFLAYAAYRTQQVDVTYPARMELLALGTTTAVFLLSLNNLQRQETTQWAVAILVTAGTLIAAYAVVQLVRQSDRVLWVAQPAGYVKRAGGTFVNPNHLAGFLVALFPLAVSHLFIGRSKPLPKILFGYASLVMLAGIAVTMSRGGWAAALLAFVFVFSWMLWRRRELRIALLVCLAVVGIGGYVFIHSVDKAWARVENVSAGNNLDGGASRKWLWAPAYRMWQDHQLLGVGPGQFDVRFPAYRPPWIQSDPGWVHNEALNVLVDYGAAGAGIAALGLAAFIWGLVKTSRFVERGSDLGLKASNRTAFFVGATSSLVGLGFHCLVDFDLHIPAIALLAALLCGLLASNLRFATERFWISSILPTRLLATLVLLASAGLLARASWNAGAESWWQNRAVKAEVITDASLDLLVRAATAAPDNSQTAYELGENLRRLSFDGAVGWREQGQRGAEWLLRSAQLNPYNARTRLDLARTRHWLGDTNAAADFDLALRLGTNDVTVANYGAWNWLERGRTNEARELLDRSLSWDPWGNWMAKHYRSLISDPPKAPLPK